MQNAELLNATTKRLTRSNKTIRISYNQILRDPSERRNQQSAWPAAPSFGNFSRSELSGGKQSKVQSGFHFEDGNREEADESAYWIKLLSAAGKVHSKTSEPLHREANELVAIAVSSINTARRSSQE